MPPESAQRLRYIWRAATPHRNLANPRATTAIPDAEGDGASWPAHAGCAALSGTVDPTFRHGQPTATPGGNGTPDTGGSGDTSGSSQAVGSYVAGSLNCAFPSTGKLLTFCAAHEFNMALPRLIGFGQINMKECATVDIQNVP